MAVAAIIIIIIIITRNCFIAFLFLFLLLSFSLLSFLRPRENKSYYDDDYYLSYECYSSTSWIYDDGSYHFRGCYVQWVTRSVKWISQTNSSLNNNPLDGWIECTRQLAAYKQEESKSSESSKRSAAAAASSANENHCQNNIAAAAAAAPCSRPYLSPYYVRMYLSTYVLTRMF